MKFNISARHPMLMTLEQLFSVLPFSMIKGIISAKIGYPIAERSEKRQVSIKLNLLRSHYKKHFDVRLAIAKKKLTKIVTFASQEVPYYNELFKSINFDPAKLNLDIRYLQDIPLLTKNIILEQGARLYSRPIKDVRHHLCKTGGSTGLSCNIAYDQSAADWSAAAVLYARERVGNKKYRSELHFACRFPDMVDPGWPTREDFKCFAMNRSNIFFDRLDDTGLNEILRTLKRRRPYMVHAHPSTIYALASYVERKIGNAKIFKVFESSGELLEPYMREKIARVFRCRVVDRYGLAELGVMAYELDRKKSGLQVLDSEGWPESILMESGQHELVFTGFHNQLMPLIRYTTGDQAKVELRQNGFFLTEVLGRIHDIIKIGGIEYPTHTIQDMLDHRVGGIQEFQIDVRNDKPILRIVPEPGADRDQITRRIGVYWSDSMKVEFVGHEDLIRVGTRAKFRHVVTT